MAVAAFLAIARFLCIGQIKYCFELVTPLPELCLEILCFDSATTGPYWAQGSIDRRQFVEVGRRLSDNDRSPMRIAVLHHHAMPIPYEHKAEPMMTLRNAGAFLEEASRRGVTLILHGHRHRFSFSRTTVRANTETASEIAILAAGSATANIEKDHNFNLITLDPRWGSIQVTPFWSRNGSPFRADEKDKFHARSASDATRAHYRSEIKRHKCFCEKTVVTVDIDCDGNAQRVHEYRGFKTLAEDGITAIPNPIEHWTLAGRLEKPKVKKLLGPANLDVTLVDIVERNDEDKLSFYSAKIAFRSNQGGQRVLKRDEDPLTFQVSHKRLKAYALSQQRYREMESPNGPEPKEVCRFVIRNIPTIELLMVVRLPTGFTMDDKPPSLFIGHTLEAGRKDGEAEPTLQQEFRAYFWYDTSLNIISVRIPYPPLDMVYRFEWALSTAYSQSGANT